MNLRPTAVFALLAGIVLLYAAVKNKYPQDVLREAMGKPAIHGPLYKVEGSGGTVPQSLSPSTGVKIVDV